MVGSDIDPTIGYLCEQTNFRLCRLVGIIENNGCDYSALPTNGVPKIINLIHLILCIVIAGFFVVLARLLIHNNSEYIHFRMKKVESFCYTKHRMLNRHNQAETSLKQINNSLERREVV